MTDLACLMSIRRSGPAPFSGSEPRKKLRQIAISGTVARSWKTVAMPRGLGVARRGEARRLAVEQQLALVVRVHAREDLDQRRLAGAVVAEHAGHLTGVDDGRDVLERDDVAEVLDDARAPRAARGHRRAPSAPPADVGVDQHRGEQDHAEEQEAPVGVPARELDADERHPDDQGAHRRADRRAEAARQQAAAGDRGDDVVELLADALAGLHRAEPERDHDADQRGGTSRSS